MLVSSQYSIYKLCARRGISRDLHNILRRVFQQIVFGVRCCRSRYTVVIYTIWSPSDWRDEKKRCRSITRRASPPPYHCTANIPEAMFLQYTRSCCVCSAADDSEYMQIFRCRSVVCCISPCFVLSSGFCWGPKGISSTPMCEDVHCFVVF